MRLRTVPMSIVILCGLMAPLRATDGVVVRPAEIDDLLANPGMGWQTFHRFADEDKNLAGLPSASAYFRFYWSEIEKTPGQIDFAMLDGLFAKAKKAGQQLAFRIMCVGTNNDYVHVPAYLKESGCKGFEFQYGGKGPVHWVPDFDDPIFQKAHFRLIEELGKRYDQHPEMDLLDIGSVGLWGEWHMSSTKVALPSPEMRRRIIEAWCKAFPTSPKVMLIGDADGLKRAFELGAGWRADCLGDMGGFSAKWCHMKDFYPQQIAKTNAGDVWKSAPVAYESCWDMRRWKQEKWDIRAIFDFALRTHASYMNNKSAPIPDGTREEVERFLRQLGYRIVLRRVEHPAQVAAGGRLELKMNWTNAGVAPPYRDYLLAVRLSGAAGQQTVLRGKTSVKGWLPGPREASETFAIPADLSAGECTLSVGLVDPRTGAPAVRLAIAGRDADGWYPVSKVTVGK